MGSFIYPRQEQVKPLEWKAPENCLKPSISETPKVELKEILENHEFTFLHGDDQLPVVISSTLSIHEKAKLLEVIRNHRGSIAWSVANIKGIDSSFYTHKILMEDEYKPTFQPQRRPMGQPRSGRLEERRDDHSKEQKERAYTLRHQRALGVENLVADHLSKLENPELGKLTKAEIRDLFPKEQLMSITNQVSASPEKRPPKSCINVTVVPLEDTMGLPQLQEKFMKLDFIGLTSFEIHKS
ncbi:hypothetical protein Tco_1576223 [Tanacetum coccineum]